MTSPVYLPLKGVRVLSFEIAFALPAGTRSLCDLGADVVRVAPPGGSAAASYISVVDGVFHGKPCISIDLTTEEGRELAFSLAMHADVVCNNFRPGVISKYGLDSQRLRAAKPDLIYLQLSGYGTPGPWSGFANRKNKPKKRSFAKVLICGGLPQRPFVC
jgi:CoA:oxalate CoA-transferase